MTKNYEEILNLAYQKYKEDWCKTRNYPIEEVEAAEANDEEYNGEMYVCLDEFEDCEFQDEGYMMYLLSLKEYEEWEKIMGKTTEPQPSTYILISVENRIINVKTFSTNEDAFNDMLECVSTMNDVSVEDIKTGINNSGFYENSKNEIYVTETSAFCMINEDMYDWVIYPIY